MGAALDRWEVRRWAGPAHLGGIGLQGVQLVHSEAELVEVDVDVDQHIGGQGGGKHPLWAGRQAG